MYKRTPETQKRYDDARERGDTVLVRDENNKEYFDFNQIHIMHDYAYWVIIKNDYPYDALFDEHDLLIPKRHFAHIREATDPERKEYYSIKKQLDNHHAYHSIIENFTAHRSARDHFHAHLVAWKD